MNRFFISALVVLLVALSGCPEGDSGGNIDFNGEMNVTEDGFRLDGEIVNGGYSAPTHQNVTVYLYRSNGTVITEKPVGTLDRRTNVSIRTVEFPKFVIINSPKFWTYSNIDVSYYEYNDERRLYREHTIDSNDEFPVEVPPAVTAERSRIVPKPSF